MRNLLLWLCRRGLRRTPLAPDYPAIARLETALGVATAQRTVPRWMGLIGTELR